MKLNVKRDNNHIYFSNKESNFLGYTNNIPQIWDAVSKLNWYIDEKKISNGKKSYIYTGSSKYGKYKNLHQIVMIILHGIEELELAYSKKWIIEHHDNQASNCSIENLSFASNDLNLVKAHSFDKRQPLLRYNVGVNLFKDFESQKYQITMAFTDQYYITAEDGTQTLVNCIRLVYEKNFRTVLFDAMSIVEDLLEFKKVDLNKLRFNIIDVDEAITVFNAPNQMLIKNNLLIIPEDFMGTKVFYTTAAPKKDLYN